MSSLHICVMILLVIASTPAGAIESWQNQSRIAHVMMENNRPAEALKRFDDAIRILRTYGGDTAVYVDLELNRVDVLTNSGRFGEARQILEQLEPLAKRFDNTALKVRYLRRFSRLASAEENFVESIKFRKANLQLIASLCNRNNSTYVRELHDLVIIAVQGKLWKDAVESASELRTVQLTCANPVNKRLLTGWLADYFDLSYGMVLSRIRDGDFAEVEKFLRLFGGCARTTASSTKVWLDVFNAAILRNQTQCADRCRIMLRELAETGRLTAADGVSIVALYMKLALVDVYDEKVSSRTETLLQEACRTLQATHKPSVLPGNTLYIQCSSLYAIALAKRNKVQEAERILDDLQLDRSSIRDIDQINGIAQARHAIAMDYLKTGNNALAHGEYKKLYKLIRSMPNLKGREDAIKGLQLIENSSIP